MRALVQEACQGPVRDAVAQHAHKLADLSEADLRPLVLRDFQAHIPMLQKYLPSLLFTSAVKDRPHRARVSALKLGHNESWMTWSYLLSMTLCSYWFCRSLGWHVSR